MKVNLKKEIEGRVLWSKRGAVSCLGMDFKAISLFLYLETLRGNGL